MAGQTLQADYFQWSDDVVGRGHPTKTDKINRALKKVLTLCGLNAESVFNGFRPVYNVRAFQAVGDGVADDTAAIQSAIDAAALAGPGGGRSGSVVFFPPGLYLVSNQIQVPEGVTLQGDARVTSIIQASATFPLGTAVVMLGKTAETITFGSRMKDMAVDGNQRADICIESTKINEFSGLWRVEFYNFQSKGIYIHGSVAQNYTLRDLYGLFSATAPNTAIGIDIDGGGSHFRGIIGLTIDCLGSQTCKAGLRINNAAGFALSQMHFENVTDGVLIGDTGSCDTFTIDGCSGSTPITTVVRVTAGQSFRINGVKNIAGATNTIVDTQRTVTITDAAAATYAVGNGATPPILNLSAAVGALTRLMDFQVMGNLFVGPPGQNTGTSKILHGQATLVAGTKVVNVSPATLVTANTRIFLGVHTPGGTPGWLQVSARVAGTSFTILSSSATDTSVVDYLMIEP